MLRFLTAGESHGKALVVIVEGLPAGLKIQEEKINDQLARRMKGYGRGARMKIESDRVEVLSGVKDGYTLASPVALAISNKDHKIHELPEVTHPRPGHADLAGMQKYGFNDARQVLERASARETAAKVAAGSLTRILLEEFSVFFASHVNMLGGIEARSEGLSFRDLREKSETSPVSCVDSEAEKEMIRCIDKAKRNGDTLGGSFEVLIDGLPAGLGTHVQADRRLDGALAGALMSIPAVKAVSIGEGIKNASRPGSSVHDEIFYDPEKKEYFRKTNRAGGIEGGMTNGNMLSVTGYMKPIATLTNALRTIDIRDNSEAKAATERSDVTAVPACAVVAEAVCAFELAKCFLEKFGSDSLKDIKRGYEIYSARLKEV